MVRAIRFRPRCDPAGTNPGATVLGGVVINFDDNKTTDDFENGYTDGSVISGGAPPAPPPPAPAYVTIKSG